MANLTRGKTFTVNEEVTNTKLHQLVDSGKVTDINRSDFNSVTTPTTASSSALSTPKTGEIWFDTVAVKMKVYNGTVFTEFSSFPWQHAGIVAETTSTEVVSCGVGAVFRDSANTKEMTITGSAQTADITVSGKGGLDAGSEASDTWYAFLIIEDSTGVNSQDTLLVKEASYPGSITFPSGYDLYRRVMWVRNDGSSDFLGGLQVGGEFSYYARGTAFATNITSATWADFATSARTSPSTRQYRMLAFTEIDGLTNGEFEYAEAGKSSGDGMVALSLTDTSNGRHRSANISSSVPCDGTSSRNTALRETASAKIDFVFVAGYTDNLAD